MRNLSRIVQTAAQKLGDRGETPGQVSPRVWKGVCDDGAFAEDAFSTEYFAGLLASSRTEDGRDDSAIPFLSLVKALSSQQLRLHFLIYASLARRGSSLESPGGEDFWSGIELRLPADELLSSMKCDDVDGPARLLLALSGLIDNQLVGNRHGLRLGLLTSGSIVPFEADGLAVSPNARGARLFLRALGSRRGMAVNIPGSSPLYDMIRI